MAQDSEMMHSPPEAPKRPKGILKNSHSQQHISPTARISPTSEHHPTESAIADTPATSNTPSRPAAPPRELSEKELTLMNTELNAGEARHHRNSSNPNSNPSRRLSSTSNAGTQQDEQNMRLKWDEANLYLNEGQMGGKMKIDEPKTPYAAQYDPMEDEAEMSALDPSELAVDELEMSKPKPKSRDSDIPGLDLGEPEMDLKTRRESDGDRKVVVESEGDDGMDVDGGSGAKHGEERVEDMSVDEREKHRKFEQMRRKHYEMSGVKNLLGHPEALDDEDEGDGKA
ncbi:uncharacterized protein LTR77_007993 [Saxophila tyrrhenica]|uniref:Glc8 protein n=1 Tax=Saxophila tyrrhenica TaxID=1690608 RepID=A0AAV9P3G5_9PEZI|nr:hypothetical protein LTR77_007993 [Saxophila tyrrhenica]